VNVFRLAAASLVMMMLYYARFFVAVRQEASTLVQIGLLVVAAVVLALPARVLPKVALNRWVVGIAAFGLAAAIFMWADRDSHSVSDTLTRAVPALCVILSIGVRLAPERSIARQ
jgi:hypothetical protein